ncbi:MAG: hypothetical protein AAB794_00155 [Patescibacteria group bacterium]
MSTEKPNALSEKLPSSDEKLISQIQEILGSLEKPLARIEIRLQKLQELSENSNDSLLIQEREMASEDLQNIREIIERMKQMQRISE